MTLDATRITALFFAMAVLAAVPGLSVLTVVSRAASAGFGHGALAAAGVVTGDLIWIALALYGLTVLIDAAGEWAWLITAAGALYLLALGAHFWRAAGITGVTTAEGHSASTSFLSGLLLTLGDQKAVLFYLGFLPAFVDLQRVTLTDAGIIGLTTVLAVGGVKLVYVALASRFSRRIDSRFGQHLNRAAAAVMMVAGIWLIVPIVFRFGPAA